MSESISIEEYRKLVGTGQTKYKSRSTVVDGIVFQSQKEANYYCRLKMLVQTGEVLYFLRQVPFHLEGGIVYRVDFLEFHKDGSYHYVDVKGYETKEFKMKKKMTEARYPVKIEIC